MKKLFILIDFHNGLETGNEVYEKEKINNIVNFLKKSKDKNIDTMEALYYGRRHDSIEFHNFDYDLSNQPDLQSYEEVYLGGISLDQCVYNTRPCSYTNIKHSNVKIMKDCAIQGLETNPFLEYSQSKVIYTKYQELQEYEDYFMDKYSVNYIKE